jgi:hypothetical protein
VLIIMYVSLAKSKQTNNYECFTATSHHQAWHNVAQNTESACCSNKAIIKCK